MAQITVAGTKDWKVRALNSKSCCARYPGCSQAMFMRHFLRQDCGVVTKLYVGLKQSPPLMLVKDVDAQAPWYLQLKDQYVRAAAREPQLRQLGEQD
jgi:hypothetical protein